MENRIIELEMKISYQEILMEELNTLATNQQVSIEKLNNRLLKLERMLVMQDFQSGVKDISAEVPPPHY